MTSIFLDCETIPQQGEEQAKAEIARTIEPPAQIKKSETIRDWHEGKGKYVGVKDAAIEDTYRKTSFDGGKGEIISMCVSDGETHLTTYRDLGESEAGLIKKVFQNILSLVEQKNHSSTPYFIGQYIAGFDLKFIFHRCVILKIKPPFKLPFDGRHNSDYYCTQAAWAGFGGRMSQDNMAKALGLPGKPDDIDGSKVWDFVKAGNVARVAEYNELDVITNIAIYNRINFK